MKFHQTVGEILKEGDIKRKFDYFAKFYVEFYENKFEFEKNFIANSVIDPSYKEFCTIVDMKNIKNQKHSNKNAMFLHSIAHIEYCAIDLALDACYRFTNIAFSFYKDWIEVAKDEIRHFNMINEILEKTGFKYGDFNVHNGLFIAMKNTQKSLLERMAIVPRFMEANGLDANYFMIEKIKNDENKKELLNILQTILDEEIEHVAKGDKWFKYACDKQNKPYDVFFDIVLKYYPNSFKTNRKLNIEARLKAGFNINEINKILSFQEKK